MAKKKRGGDDGGGGGSWMDTYGDLVTLLLCFFVLLFASSSVDEAKWRDLVATFAGGPTVVVQPLDAEQVVSDAEEEFRAREFDRLMRIEAALDSGQNPSEINTNDQSPNTGLGEMSQIQQTFDNLFAELKTYVIEHELAGALELAKEEDKILLRFKDNLLFDLGQAELKPDSLLILNDVALMLLKAERAIRSVRIEGHTDDIPISSTNELYKDNWNLSSARAESVLRYLIGNDQFPENKMYAAYFGETKPLYKNDSDENRARNRRVELVIEREYLTIPVGGGTTDGLMEEILDVLE